MQVAAARSASPEPSASGTLGTPIVAGGATEGASLRFAGGGRVVVRRTGRSPSDCGPNESACWVAVGGPDPPTCCGTAGGGGGRDDARSYESRGERGGCGNSGGGAAEGARRGGRGVSISLGSCVLHPPGGRSLRPADVPKSVRPGLVDAPGGAWLLGRPAPGDTAALEAGGAALGELVSGLASAEIPSPANSSLSSIGSSSAASTSAGSTASTSSSGEGRDGWPCGCEPGPASLEDCCSAPCKSCSISGDSAGSGSWLGELPAIGAVDGDARCHASARGACARRMGGRLLVPRSPEPPTDDAASRSSASASGRLPSNFSTWRSSDSTCTGRTKNPLPGL
jgi:hypothetical protein